MSDKLIFQCPICNLIAYVPTNAKRIICACGFRTIEIKPIPFVLERLDICKQCEFFFEKKCSFLNECIGKFRKKLTNKTVSCPMNKWSKL